MHLSSRLLRALRLAGLPVDRVYIGIPAERATWIVEPLDLQAAAAPIIATFDPDDPQWRGPADEPSC